MSDTGKFIFVICLNLCAMAALLEASRTSTEIAELKASSGI